MTLSLHYQTSSRSGHSNSSCVAVDAVVAFVVAAVAAAVVVAVVAVVAVVDCLGSAEGTGSVVGAAGFGLGANMKAARSRCVGAAGGTRKVGDCGRAGCWLVPNDGQTLTGGASSSPRVLLVSSRAPEG